MQRGHTIKILDHGYVKFISSMGEDSDIIEAARMSTNRGFEGWEDREECTVCEAVKTENNLKEICRTQAGVHSGGVLLDIMLHEPHQWKKKPGDSNLLDFLYRHKHSTPFEMCELHLEIQAPILAFRQLHRHRTFSVNEMSGRYTQMPDLFYVPDMDRMQTQSQINKQGSSNGTIDLNDAENFIRRIRTEQNDIHRHYEDFLEGGLAREVARINTPLSQYSRMRWKTDLRNWVQMCNSRMRPNVQWETKQFIDAASTIIRELWPRTYALFEEYDLYGVRFSRTEMEVLRSILGNLPNDEFIDADYLSSKGLNTSKGKEFLEKLTNGGKKIL
jgi:thymidylate synthase (FAD)